MTTEYVLTEGDVLQEVARDLMDQAESPDQVHWSPRPDVYGGGVFVLADEGIAQRTVAARRARRAEQAAQIEAAQKAADERDSDPAVAEGLATPAEAGFAADRAVAPAPLEDADDDEDAEDDEADDDEDAEPVEQPLTTAQKRAAAKAAKQKAAADAAAAEEKAE